MWDVLAGKRLQAALLLAGGFSTLAEMLANVDAGLRNPPAWSAAPHHEWPTVGVEMAGASGHARHPVERWRRGNQILRNLR